jgi:hypothetical protein
MDEHGKLLLIDGVGIVGVNRFKRIKPHDATGQLLALVYEISLPKRLFKARYLYLSVCGRSGGRCRTVGPIDCVLVAFRGKGFTAPPDSLRVVLTNSG